MNEAPYRLSGTAADTLSWIPEVEIEQEAMKQIRNVAALPWVDRVRLMPDVHAGVGATIGSVIAMRDAVSPSAVGVDIGCFTGDTLVTLLDSNSYRMDELAERGTPFHVYACSEDAVVGGALATAKKTRHNAELVAVTLDNGEVIRCTPDHEFMMRDTSFKRADSLSEGDSLMPFDTSLDKDGYLMIRQPHSVTRQRAHWVIARSGVLGDIPSFENDTTIIHHKDFNKTNNSPSNLEFMSSRGHSSYHRSLVEHNSHWQSAEFEEKRVAALREKANTPEGHAYFAERGTKNIKRYMEERPEHFKEAVSGNGQRGKAYLTGYNQSEQGRQRSSEMANELRECPECGEMVKSYIGLFNHRKSAHGYVANNHKVVSVVALENREDVYCLTVPEYGNFALSAGVFVHNCGMTGIMTNLTAADLPENLHSIRSDIERDVPVGFNGYSGEAPIVRRDRALKSRFDALFGQYEGLKAPDMGEKFGKSLSQCGTLGGGNHFIELCVDDEDRVWLMLHSGSRGIGNILASRHIDKAKGLEHNLDLPDRNLAVFLRGTDLMDDYLHDLWWAQDYALLNRDVMMASVFNVIKKHFPKASILDEVKCHHNYVAVEHLSDGTELIVTRKGAISAHKDQLGLIPGSMGNGSYVVRGLGNEEGLFSASHGAGRKMSRSAAKRSFTVADLKRQTKGVECRKDEGVLDEIPGAYKDLQSVIDTQSTGDSPLVEVVARLNTLLCVKG